MKTESKNILMAVSGLNEIPFIAEGLESTVTGFVISEDGLTRIAEALQAGDAATKEAATLQGAVTAAQAAKETAEAALVTANGFAEGQAAMIESLQARVNELEAEPAVSTTSKKTDDVKTAKVEAYNDPQLPFNALADRLMGVKTKIENED